MFNKLINLQYTWVPAVASAAGGIVGDVANLFGQNAANKQQQKYNTNMYNLQRQQSLSDWNMQNTYNAPQAQMQRLKAAGLNPNLVYGQGVQGATGQSGAVRPTTAQSYSPKSITTGLGDLGSQVSSSLLAGQDVNLKGAQANNVQAQTDVAKQDKLLREAQTANVQQDTINKAHSVPLTDVNTETGKFELGQKQRLADTQVEAAKANLQQTYASIFTNLDTNERNNLLSQNTFMLGLQSVMNSRIQNAKTDQERINLESQLNNIKNSATLQQLDINLKKQGMTWSDPMVLRMGGAALNNGTLPKSLTETSKDLEKTWFGTDTPTSIYSERNSDPWGSGMHH
ncbi:DNA pilot protein VP2 [Microviridae Fen7918_21]|uniref:DNA pilot protein VP2 n=1 Tax=Microviridae Fen7918_21 TaxID=1655661 RepID=UPI00063D62DC|nr:DNA pilot protein VP2 [Microviridae Fen7918_21]AKI26950.1 DNA pilot protein VP2 [Microviridae Fen7918_21]